MKLAVAGATGLVGQEVLKILDERDFLFSDLIPIASERSKGKKVTCKGQEYPVVGMQDAIDMRPDVAIFSAGGGTSLEWAPKFAKAGTIVIDNSSAWRMDPTKKLVVPEINGHVIEAKDRIIANPNCSTIQMVMALAPLHERYKIRRIVVSTYQSVTGTGKAAVDQMNNERSGISGEMVYPHPIDKNALPHIDAFQEGGYTKEEMKMVNETQKILGDDSVQVTATCVRIPTVGGHSEAVNVEFEDDFELKGIFDILSGTSGVIVQDDPDNNIYPTPLNAHNRDEVFVGRIRRDQTQPKTLNMWIVSDNLRKGAATNAIQIAEYICKEFPGF